MAKTVNEAFEKFNREIVNLDPDRTKKARGSRDWLIGQMTGFPDKVDGFPKLYEGMSIAYGSFSRNVKIQPLDDIDMFLTFSGEGTTYTTEVEWLRYTLSVPESATKLKALCNDDGTLNSIKLVNKLVLALKDVDQYKEADIKRNKEAATLKLSSYEWNFDIVPAFYAKQGFYIIPDGQGLWKASDPRIDDSKLKQVNQKHGGKVNQLIRVLKYWNRRAMMTTIPSYLFENIVIRYLESKDSINDFIHVNAINFWYHLEDAIYNNVPDPKGFQGNLNTLSLEQKKGIAQKAHDAAIKGHQAYNFETQDKDQAKAISKWREIFGDNFPTYE